MWAQHSFKKQTNPACQPLRVPPRGTVLSFAGEWIVMLVVLLNICVISVKVHMQSFGVIFRDQSRAPSSQPLPAKSQSKK